MVGYVRNQVSDDVNSGAAFGGTINGRSRQVGIGIGYSKRFGPTELNINLVKEISTRSDIGGTKLQVNLFTPVKF
jgi:hypothetical protein